MLDGIRASAALSLGMKMRRGCLFPALRLWCRQGAASPVLCRMGLRLALARSSKHSWRPLGSLPAGRVATIFPPRRTLTSRFPDDLPSRAAQDAAAAEPDTFGGRTLTPSTSSAPPEEKIYIAGWAGPIGGLMAHSLATMPNRPPIVLLHHRPSLYESWKQAGEVLTLQKYGIKDAQRGFESQMAMRRTQRDQPDAEPIYSLILSSKAPRAASALKELAWRLRPESTVVFLQNGMGNMDVINEKVFPNLESRPNYMMGIVTHAAQASPDFVVKHKGSGSIALTALPREPLDPRDAYQPKPADSLPESTKYLLRKLTGAPALCALGLRPLDFLQLQLEKLAANAVISPLTAILGCSNGELVTHTSTLRVMRLLMAEISLVICSLPEISHLPKVRQRFSPRSLELYVNNIVKQTAENRSSMLQDIDRGRRTEIAFINGYIIRRGEELGIRCITNYMVVQMVKSKEAIAEANLESMVPLEEKDDESEPLDLDSEDSENREVRERSV